jgi:hypothetical protein
MSSLATRPSCRVECKSGQDSQDLQEKKKSEFVIGILILHLLPVNPVNPVEKNQNRSLTPYFTQASFLTMLSVRGIGYTSSTCPLLDS